MGKAFIGKVWHRFDCGKSRCMTCLAPYQKCVNEVQFCGGKNPHKSVIWNGKVTK